MRVGEHAQLDLAIRRFDLGSRDDAAEATMSSDVANRVRQVKVDPPVVTARKQVVVEGASGRCTNLVPSTRILFPVCLELLHKDRRTDLLEE